MSAPMSDDYRVVAARQTASFATSWLAGKVRDRRPKVKPEDIPEPDRPALREAEKLLAGQEPAPGQSVGELVAGPLLVPDDLFVDVEDRDEAKLVLIRALRAKEPVHVLLSGPAATGKSELLKSIARLPNSRWAAGGATSSSGLIEYLLERPGTQILIVDELDKADMRDLHALYGLMQSGQVSRLQHGATESFTRKVRVFASANDLSKIPSPLLSRFWQVSCRPYTGEQLRAINQRTGEREGLSPAAAARLSERVSARTSDPRVARDLARMGGPDGEIDDLLEHVTRPQPAKGE
jgi:MoxR-like ATPase